MLKQALTSDTLSLFKPQDSSLESFAGQVHHSSWGMDSLCGCCESSTRAASQRGVAAGCGPARTHRRRACLHSRLPHLLCPRLLIPTSGCVWDPAGTGRGSVHDRRSCAVVATGRLQLPFRIKKRRKHSAQ